MAKKESILAEALRVVPLAEAVEIDIGDMIIRIYDEQLEFRTAGTAGGNGWLFTPDEIAELAAHLTKITTEREDDG